MGLPGSLEGAEARSEGWIVLESLETLDVYGGDRFRSRHEALAAGLAGDASLASSGEACFTRELGGAFLLGRLWSARRVEPDGRVMLCYELRACERHVMPVREAPPRPTGPTRPWTCPDCETTWQILSGEAEIPDDASHCPRCGGPPSTFTPGQVVRVREPSRRRVRTRLGIIYEAVRAAVPVPGKADEARDEGPYTGEFMVWYLSQGYGSKRPLPPEDEEEVFRGLSPDPERRLGFMSHLGFACSTAAERIQALTSAEEKALFGLERRRRR